MRPNFAFDPSLKEAVQKGLRAARQNLSAMLVLQGAMAIVVASYYCWPAAAATLSRYASWQHAGGILAAAAATAFAGGILSELSLVYIQDRGRWSTSHLENLGFKLGIFFINGAIVYEFYAWQAVWFGDGTAWSVLLPKIFVDQFIYSVLWAVPFQAVVFRWQALRYSGPRLRMELNRTFVTERMLPVLVTTWMFWIPGVTLIYSLPLILQTPLFIFATAIWGLLLPAVSRQERTGVAPEPVLSGPAILASPAE